MAHTLSAEEYTIPDEHKIYSQEMQNDIAWIETPKMEEVKERQDIPKKDPNYVNKGIQLVLHYLKNFVIT